MLPIQGPVDPKDDHHEKEYFSEAGDLLLSQRECLHDWQEVNDTTCYCRLCGKAERWKNLPAINDTVMMKAYGMTFVVPMNCLPEQFQSTIKNLRSMQERN
tara:strand:- start:440 stop:742 length:303 start_codon:yes stop_codon:yes gene_type:complete